MNKLRDLLSKSLVVGVIVLFIGIGIQPAISDVNKETYKPISKGNTLYVGGIGEDNYTKIQDAINDASESDTVFVFDDSSPYFENLILNKSIDLIGEDYETTIIDGNKISYVVNISADKVYISGFTIQNSGKEYFSDGGILLFSNFNTIINNIITHNENGIYILDSEFNTISDNIINWNVNNGIFLWDSNNKITGNNIYSNENYGITLLDSNYNIISNNMIERNGYWGEVIWSGGGIKLDNSSYNTIAQNNISRNCLFSINLVYYSKNNIIKGNIISQHSLDIGIELSEFCDNSYIEGNDISNNFIGISINSKNNTIQKNNFFKNVFSTVFSIANNTWDQNYWNRPRFLPKPIFGMVEKNSKWKLHICFDKNPAKEPYNI